MHGAHGFRQSRSAGGQTDNVYLGEPIGAQFFRALDVKCPLAGSAASLDQLPRVIALPTADYDDRLGVGDQLPQSELPIFCRPANRIDKSHLGIRMRAADKIDNIPDEIDRLGCLRNDSVTSARRKFRNIVTGIYDNGLGEVSD